MVSGLKMSWKHIKDALLHLLAVLCFMNSNRFRRNKNNRFDFPSLQGQETEPLFFFLSVTHSYNSNI